MTTTNNFNFKLIDLDKNPWVDDEHGNWHIVDALMARYLSVANVQGIWENALAVTVGQRYIDTVADTIYEVLVAHTTSSTTTFAVERAAQTSYWQAVSIDVSFQGTWTAGTTYAVNSYVVDSGRYGIVAVAHTAVTSYDTGVTNGDIVTLIDSTTIIAATHTTNDVAAGGTSTATYVQSTGVFDFGLVTGDTGATGATGAAGSNGTSAGVGLILALG